MATRVCLVFVVQAKSQFKSRSIANNVEIIIPVPNDVDSPTFKASIGSVAYLPDQVSYVLCCAVSRGGCGGTATVFHSLFQECLVVCFTRWLVGCAPLLFLNRAACGVGQLSDQSIIFCSMAASVTPDVDVSIRLHLRAPPPRRERSLSDSYAAFLVGRASSDPVSMIESRVPSCTSFAVASSTAFFCSVFNSFQATAVQVIPLVPCLPRIPCMFA